MSKDLTNCNKVCFYCSDAKQFGPLAKRVRKFAPEAHLTIISAPGPWIEEHAGVADNVVEEVFSLRSLTRPGILMRHIRLLRQERFDCLVTQYESLRLRLFISLVRPARAEMWLPMFGEHRLPVSFVATMWDMACLRARGYSNMLRAFIHATIMPVRIPPKDS